MANRYWVGGANTWNGTAGTKWSTTSGGAGGAAVPTAADDVYFDANSGAVLVQLLSARVCRSIDFTGFTGTFQHGGTLTVGTTTAPPGGVAVKLVAGMTYTGGNPFSLVSTHASVHALDFGGKTVTSVTVNGAGATYQLVAPLVATGTLTVTAGGFDANGYAVTVPALASSNNNVRSVTMGAGQWTLNGTGTVWNVATATNLTLTVTGSPPIIVNDASATARTISIASAITDPPSFDITAGSGALTISSGARVRHLNFTGFAGSVAANAFTVLGDLTMSASMTFSSSTTTLTLAPDGARTLTQNGATVLRPITIDGTGSVTLASDLTLGDGRLLSVVAGTFDTANYDVAVGRFASTGSGTRSVDFGTSTVTLTDVGPSTVLQISGSNLTLTLPADPIAITAATASTRTISLDGATVTDIDLDITAGTGTVSLTGANSPTARHVDLTGFAGTLSTSFFRVIGDLTLSSGMTLGAGQTINMAAPSGTATLTTAGATILGSIYLGFAITSTATFVLADDLTGGADDGSSLLIESGTFDDGDHDITIGTVGSTSAVATREWRAGSGTYTVLGFQFYAGTLTVDPGLEIVLAPHGGADYRAFDTTARVPSVVVEPNAVNPVTIYFVIAGEIDRLEVPAPAELRGWPGAHLTVRDLVFTNPEQPITVSISDDANPGTVNEWTLELEVGIVETQDVTVTGATHLTGGGTWYAGPDGGGAESTTPPSTGWRFTDRPPSMTPRIQLVGVDGVTSR